MPIQRGMGNSLLSALLMFGVVAFGAWRMIRNSESTTASDDPIGGWAVMAGFEPCPRPSIGTTALTRMGDQVVGECYEVPVGPQGGAMYQLLINVGSDREPQFVPVVVVQAVLAAGFPQFGVYPKSDGLPKSLMHPGMRKVEFESADFADRFHVIADDDAPDERLRRLFDPETLVWWVDSCADMRIEYEYSCLCVAQRPAGGWAELDAHLAAAQGIADRVVEAGAATLRG